MQHLPSRLQVQQRLLHCRAVTGTRNSDRVQVMSGHPTRPELFRTMSSNRVTRFEPENFVQVSGSGIYLLNVLISSTFTHARRYYPKFSFWVRVIPGRVGCPHKTRTRPELLAITCYLTQAKKRYPKHHYCIACWMANTFAFDTVQQQHSSMQCMLRAFCCVGRCCKNEISPSKYSPIIIIIACSKQN